MAFHLPEHISFGFIGDRAVVLDAAADQYLLLAKSETAVLAGADRGSQASFDRLTVDRLAERGVIVAGAGKPIAPVRAAPATASALDLPGPLARIGFVEAGRWRAAASLSLRVAGLGATIDRWRGLQARHGVSVVDAPQTPPPDHRERAADVARGFAHARLFLPARRRCVPDSLALMSCLRRRAIPAELYFGVRLAPFAAHCWVQADDLLLSDSADIVREFTPVFRL